MAGLLARNADWTLRQLQTAMEKQTGVRFGEPYLWRVLKRMNFEEATDADIFLAYLDHVLCPQLRPGDVVVMDNFSSHKVKGVRERIEAAGGELLYLPPYSPDLNPIEKAWAKLKQLLRDAKARSNEALDEAITQHLPEITPENAQAWFRLRFGTL